MFTWKNILLGIGIILTDLIIYILLGISLMSYDDLYDESKGEYWSLASMTTFQQVIYIGLNVWNVINVVALIAIFIYAVRRIRNQQRSTSPW